MSTSISKKIKEKMYPVYNSDYKAISKWREDERPRERLMKYGAATLTDSELLAILISSGTHKFSALDAARTLIEKYESLSKMSACDFSEFKNIYGMGNAKAIKLAAAFEISRRVQSQPFDSSKQIRTPEDIAAIFIPRLREERIEKFYAILLNSANQAFRIVVVSQGTLNASVVHAREVFRIAIIESAASVILLHNHPSGNLEPSKEDIEITKKLVEAGKMIDIKVLDHIIIGGSGFTSFSKRGLI